MFAPTEKSKAKNKKNVIVASRLFRIPEIFPEMVECTKLGVAPDDFSSKVVYAKSRLGCSLLMIWQKT